MQFDPAVQLGKLHCKNPVMLASGTGGYGYELESYMDTSALGAVMLKALTLQPRAGNAPQRIAESPGGIINAIGLQNMGYESFLRNKVPAIEASGIQAIANISGSTIDDYGELCARLEELGCIAAIELNVSCPNVREGGIQFGQDPLVLADLVQHCRKKCTKPLIVKLSPNVTDIRVMARAVEEHGADIISAINTLSGMAVNIETCRPVLHNNTGGFSGPAVKPVALKMVHDIYRSVSIPVIGMGGIMSGDDAVAFMLAGASAVAVGTATLVDPSAAFKVLQGLEAYCRRKGIEKASDLTGKLQTY